MAFRLHHSSNFTKMVIVGELIVVSYLLYTLTVSVYKSYQIDQYITSFKNDNQRIAEENRQKEEDYSYYTSDAYVEKIAKQNLGLVNPGEQVVVIANSDLSSSNSNGQSQNDDLSSNLSNQTLTNPQKWWKFFFDFQANKT